MRAAEFLHLCLSLTNQLNRLRLSTLSQDKSAMLHVDTSSAQTSPGLVTDTNTEYRGISKYRYRSRYSKYRKIPKKKCRKKSVFQFCKYNPLVIRVYAHSSGQLSQIEPFPRSVYSVILHKIVMTIQYSLS